MSEDMREGEFQEAVAKYFPSCPLCGSKTLEFDIELGQKYDYVTCHDCNASWEIEWKGEGSDIKSIELIEVRDVEKNALKGKKHDPKFWLTMALKQTEKVQPTPKVKEVQSAPQVKEIIREKEVIVKIRCHYCNHVYDETLDKCPYCGGSR